jgi:hypothetical protein
MSGSATEDLVSAKPALEAPADGDTSPEAQDGPATAESLPRGLLATACLVEGRRAEPGATEWGSEWKPLAWIAGIFVVFYFLPVGTARFDGA